MFELEFHDSIHFLKVINSIIFDPDKILLLLRSAIHNTWFSLDDREIILLHDCVLILNLTLMIVYLKFLDVRALYNLQKLS